MGNSLAIEGIDAAYGAVRITYMNLHGGPHTPSQIAHDINSTGARSMYVFNTDGVLYVLTGIPLPTRFPLPAHLLRDINRTRAVVVVEHDMAFVRALGVKVTVPSLFSTAVPPVPLVTLAIESCAFVLSTSVSLPSSCAAV